MAFLDTLFHNLGLQEPRIFVAWSKETEQAAKIIRDQLEAHGLSAWLSDEIKPGQLFRNEIRKTILRANLVIAVFPETPSPWQIAEAGLAYFEQKLIPVAIDRELVIEPFGELQTHTVTQSDLDKGSGETIDNLIDVVGTRLGQNLDETGISNFVSYANRLFFTGVPLVGIVIVLIILILGTQATESELSTELHLWKAGHTIFGAIVYGGGIFVSLLFARAGTSQSFSERRFGFHTARRLFYVWFLVAIFQLIVGFCLLALYSNWNYGENPWLIAGIYSYIFSLFFWWFGYSMYSRAYTADKDQKSLMEIHKSQFWGNLCFGMATMMITFVVVAMSLQNDFNIWWFTATGATQ